MITDEGQEGVPETPETVTPPAEGAEMPEGTGEGQSE